MGPMILGVIAATVGWYFIFGTGSLNFWWGMAGATTALALWSILWAGDKRRRMFRFKPSYFFWGLISAAILYFIFWAGDLVSAQLFSFAPAQIASIYANRVGMDPAAMALLLFFIIGPAEEIFWRGMVQRTIARNFGDNTGLVTGAVIYALVHLWSANFILVMAALICGLYWGWIYQRTDSLWPSMVSHAVWDVIIFLVYPIR